MKRFDINRTSGLYRSRSGVFFGVCRGVAEYFDLNVFWTRFFVFVMFLLSGIWPMLVIYIIASFIMKPEPIRPIESEAEQEFYDSYVYSRQRAVMRLKRRFKDLERRIRRMEDSVTSREFDWDQKLNGSL